MCWVNLQFLPDIYKTPFEIPFKKRPFAMAKLEYNLDLTYSNHHIRKPCLLLLSLLGLSKPKTDSSKQRMDGMDQNPYAMQLPKTTQSPTVLVFQPMRNSFKKYAIRKLKFQIAYFFSNFKNLLILNKDDPSDS